jgi:hypothetical protein
VVSFVFRHCGRLASHTHTTPALSRPRAMHRRPTRPPSRYPRPPSQ